LQFDSATPASSSGAGSNSYTPAGPLITNIVDQTNGNSWFTASYIPWRAQTSLSLSSSTSSSSLHAQVSSYGVDAGYTADLSLGLSGALPTSPLSSAQLTSVPLNPAASSLKYDSSVDVLGNSFTASVDSISTSANSAPEPGALTLLLLGAAGLSVHGVRMRGRKRAAAGS
jgi:hypothetical protein